MREIMFRGKRKDNGEWVFGSVVHQTDYYGDIRDRWFILKGDSTNDYDIDYPIEVQKGTVGQYTGLTDRNGKRIFEGDICKGINILHPSRKIYQAGFEDGLFGLYDNGGTLWHYDHIDDVEVIGNIHDNPELLEGERK